jgi:peptidoglycan/xylan/chitin deacetylase (PgdA/CDA1 family)
MAATFFVITGRVGSTGYCTWDDLREMGRAGMSLQSHTHTHPFLSQLDRDAVLVELRRSREELDDQLGQRTTTLALPGGDFPRGWRATDFRDAGYRWVATSRWGPNDVAHDTFFVRRYTVRRETRLEAFVRMAEGSAPAYSAEGLRLTALNGLRSLLGASRYARWRRRFLVSLGR